MHHRFHDKEPHDLTVSMLVKYRNQIYTIILCVACVFAADAQRSKNFDVNELAKMSSDQLVSESVEYIGVDSMAPRMLAAMNIVYNRWIEDPANPAARRTAVRALQNIGNYHMTRSIDYRKAYKYLWNAKQIAEEDGDLSNLASIYNSLANLYYFSAGDIANIKKKVPGMLNKAAEAAMQTHNELVLACIAQNIAIISASARTWGDFAPVVPKILKYNYRTAIDAGNMGNAMLIATGFIITKEWDKAEATLQSVNPDYNGQSYSERYRYAVDKMLLRVYELSNNYAKSIPLAHSMLAEAKKGGNRDYELTLYDDLADIHKSAGRKDSVEYYQDKYLSLKSKFEEENSFGAVQELDFENELDRINKEVQQLSVKHQKERRDRIITMVACIVLTLILLWIGRMYINIKRSQRKLFANAQETVEREKQHQMMRAVLDPHHTLQAQPSHSDTEEATIVTEVNTASTIPVEEDSLEDTESAATISDEESERLKRVYARILIAMEENADIYQPDFAIYDLAKIVKAPVGVVSKSINYCHKVNFPTLLNEYRIREVMRLMQSPDSECLTIESLAEEVGFKSRTSFATIFKKRTGLTPSEYFKMAKKSHNQDVAVN